MSTTNLLTRRVKIESQLSMSENDVTNKQRQIQRRKSQIQNSNCSTPQIKGERKPRLTPIISLTTKEQNTIFERYLKFSAKVNYGVASSSGDPNSVPPPGLTMAKLPMFLAEMGFHLPFEFDLTPYFKPLPKTLSFDSRCSSVLQNDLDNGNTEISSENNISSNDNDKNAIIQPRELFLLIQTLAQEEEQRQVCGATLLALHRDMSRKMSKISVKHMNDSKGNDSHKLETTVDNTTPKILNSEEAGEDNVPKELATSNSHDASQTKVPLNKADEGHRQSLFDKENVIDCFRSAFPNEKVAGIAANTFLEDMENDHTIQHLKWYLQGSKQKNVIIKAFKALGAQADDELDLQLAKEELVDSCELHNILVHCRVNETINQEATALSKKMSKRVLEWKKNACSSVQRNASITILPVLAPITDNVKQPSSVSNNETLDISYSKNFQSKIVASYILERLDHHSLGVCDFITFQNEFLVDMHKLSEMYKRAISGNTSLADISRKLGVQPTERSSKSNSITDNLFSSYMNSQGQFILPVGHRLVIAELVAYSFPYCVEKVFESIFDQGINDSRPSSGAGRKVVEALLSSRAITIKPPLDGLFQATQKRRKELENLKKEKTNVDNTTLHIETTNVNSSSQSKVESLLAKLLDISGADKKTLDEKIRRLSVIPQKNRTIRTKRQLYLVTLPRYMLPRTVEDPDTIAQLIRVDYRRSIEREKRRINRELNKYQEQRAAKIKHALEHPVIPKIVVSVDNEQCNSSTNNDHKNCSINLKKNSCGESIGNHGNSTKTGSSMLDDDASNNQSPKEKYYGNVWSYSTYMPNDQQNTLHTPRPPVANNQQPSNRYCKE